MKDLRMEMDNAEENTFIFRPSERQKYIDPLGFIRIPDNDRLRGLDAAHCASFIQLSICCSLTAPIKLLGRTEHSGERKVNDK